MNPVHGAYGEFFLEYSLMAEYKLLAKQKLPGVFVVPSGRTPLCWNGVIFVRQGLYQGGVFKLAIFIPHDFPDSSCPKLVFDPPVYHPLVNPDTGELDVHRAFSKWRRNVNHIWQVLMYARRVFHKVETDSPLNPHAAKLYTTDVDQFKAKVEECIEGCLERAVVQPHNPDQTSSGLSSSSSDDPMAICFSHMDPMQLKQAKDAMASFRRRKYDYYSQYHQHSGYSWVQPGSYHSFSQRD
ncbi:AKT-interacting protein-like isoform X2 [Symsagittifera roscoffensis]|uniref:AKT-interacting protein-like isoform X2 n=1 Tax=Symsagittifera roscoffensis TaxID=84072 RepID=UPI00307B72F8